MRWPPMLVLVGALCVLAAVCAIGAPHAQAAHDVAPEVPAVRSGPDAPEARVAPEVRAADMPTTGDAATARPEAAIEIAHFRMQRGDDAAWAAPGFDDRAWQPVTFASVTDDGGPIWLRASVELGQLPADRPLGLLVAGIASHEVFWDGVRLGAGGVVGASAAAETPGPVSVRHWIPGQLAAPGRHVVALRLSAFHRNVPLARPLWAVVVGPYDALDEIATPYLWLAISSLSGLVLGAVFALAMFLAHRQERGYLHLSALCMIAAVLLVAESWRPLIGYTYEWHGPRLVIIATLTWLLNAVVVAFTVARLPGRRPRLFVGIAAVAMLPAWFAPGWDEKSWLMFLIGLGLALGWTLRAARVRQSGSRSMALALAASIALLWISPKRFADASVFVALDFLLLCLAVPYALERRRERAHRERVARLETELLRKQLQPHFLMNTLTALAEWVDEDPRVAGEMIGALADELRLLHEIVDRPLIAMAEELRLCRAHLALLSRRKGRDYRLVAVGIDDAWQVPPAIFHSLVENAVTHGDRASAVVEMRLTGEHRGARIRYVFEAPLRVPAEPLRPEGAGTRYIRARLRECFGARATFTAGASGAVWRTEIETPR